MARSKHPNPQPATPYAVWGVCGFLFAAVWFIYGPILDHGFLEYDDRAFVFGNQHVTAGLTIGGVKWAFTDGPFGEWYPLALLSHMLDCQLFGLNAWGHHLTNLLLHAAGSIALFLVWRSMTGEFWTSAFVATVFAVHPQQVESVAWIAERRDVLSGLLFMLVLGAYLGYVRHGRSLDRYCLLAALLALGLMAKPMLVTVPPLLLLLDFWPLGRLGAAGERQGLAPTPEQPGLRLLLLEKLPLFALAAGDCLITLRTHSPRTDALTWSERFGNGVIFCVAYVADAVWPSGLSVFHPLPAGGLSAWEWRAAGAVALLAAASTAAVVWRRRCPYLFVGWFWYLGMIFPVLGMVGASNQTMSDRYMYLPGIGLSIAAAWGASRLCAGSAAGRLLLPVAAGLIVVVLISVAIEQTAYWRNDETLWRRALASNPDNGQMETSLADTLNRQDRVDEAILFYRRAQQHSRSAIPVNNLGSALRRVGRLDEAIAQYRLAVARQPGYFLAHLNLGDTLAQKGQFDEALREIHRAIEIDPRQPNGYVVLAHALMAQKKLDEACAELEKAVAVAPNNATAHNELGAALLELGRIDESLHEFEVALTIDPDHVLACTNLALVLAARGRTEQAIRLYQRALDLEPGNADARRELDRLRRGGGRPSP